MPVASAASSGAFDSIEEVDAPIDEADVAAAIAPPEEAESHRDGSGSRRKWSLRRSRFPARRSADVPREIADVQANVHSPRFRPPRLGRALARRKTYLATFDESPQGLGFDLVTARGDPVFQAAVSSVAEGSLAAGQKMQVGDLVVKVNDDPVDGLTKDQVIELLSNAGRPLRVLLRRTPAPQSNRVESERPPSSITRAHAALRVLTPHVTRLLKLPIAVLVLAWGANILSRF